jgi:hypothetical protein
LKVILKKRSYPIERPHTATIALILLFLSGLFWISLGVIGILGLHPALPEDAFLRWTMIISAIVTGMLLWGSIILLMQRKRYGYYFIICFLGVLLLLSIMDDFGIMDLMALMVLLAAFLLLIINRHWFSA